MFFEPNEGGRVPCNPVIRTLIVSLAVLSLAFGIGPPASGCLGWPRTQHRRSCSEPRLNFT